ncbi:CD209 antigen-like protein C [Hoplias malabaricus]|uniref:CD209 antigen-like protein C n=1 Tax=Hoplias malabaricus TaxID=27720 RepID=UPI003462E99D
MENIYGNVDFHLSQTPRKDECCTSADAGDHTDQSVRGRTPFSTEKCALAAVSLLLFCAVGVLYLNKGVSYEALSEDYSRALERLSVQEHNISETQRKNEKLRLKNLEAEEMVSQCSVCKKCVLCGDSWTMFGVKCYYFSTDKLNWTMSRDYCTGKGGHLVIITSKEEQDFVSSQTEEKHWIGLNDLEKEGEWTWVNNQSLKETGVTFWFQRTGQQSEPDNWKIQDPSGENCAELDVSNLWLDGSCRILKKYICEKKHRSI